MDEKQADAAAQAILEPHLRAQETRSEQIRARQAAEDAYLARKRRAAWLVLAGAGIGILIAYFGEFRFVTGIAVGGICGGLAGLLVTRRTAA